MEDSCQKAGYLEANDVSSYEHADALEEVSQSVDEGSSDSQAAMLPLMLPGPRTWGSWSTMRVTVTVGVEVTALV